MFCIDIMDDSEDSEDSDSNSDSDKIPMGPEDKGGGWKLRGARLEGSAVSDAGPLHILFPFQCFVPFHFFMSSFVVFHFIFL